MFKKMFVDGLKIINKHGKYRKFYRSSILFDDKNKNNDPLGSNILSKYEPFREDRAPIIFDVEEERKKQMNLLEEDVLDDDSYDQFYGISPERGETGVIEVEELVDILRKENAQDIFVCSVPPEYRYVSHMVIVSGKSRRHMLGIAEFVRKVYKYKRGDGDIIPSIEGKGSHDWIALDLGNIALHVFAKNKRLEYDLESLWSLGSELDTLANQPDDPVVQILKQHSIVVGELNKDLTNQ